MNIERIEWDDSNGVVHWFTLDEIKKISEKQIVSVGYVIHETATAVYLAQSDDRDPDESDRHFNFTMIIVKSAIKKREVLG